MCHGTQKHLHHLSLFHQRRCSHHQRFAGCYMQRPHSTHQGTFAIVSFPFHPVSLSSNHPKKYHHDIRRHLHRMRMHNQQRCSRHHSFAEYLLPHQYLTHQGIWQKRYMVTTMMDFQPILPQPISPKWLLTKLPSSFISLHVSLFLLQVLQGKFD